MLLQLENAHQDDLEKLFDFAKKNNLTLSLLDENDENYLLPGKPLTNEELTELILKSRNGGRISIKDAHQVIRSSYGAD